MGHVNVNVNFCTCTCQWKCALNSVLHFLVAGPHLKLSLRYILGAVEEKLSKD